MVAAAGLDMIRRTLQGLDTQPRYFRGQWNHVLIDGSIDTSLIKEWIDKSYELVVAGLTKRDQRILHGSDDL